MSAQETTENFWKIWNSFEWPDIKPIFYRCYYHEDGTADFYTMEDLPGRWIEIDQETYTAGLKPNSRVINGQLQIPRPKKIIKKLKPNQANGVCCDPKDVCVVVGDNGVKWNECDNEID